MNILMLGWELPPYNSGGLGVACFNMAKALARAGADIDFVLPHKADYSHVDFMRLHAASHLPPGPQYGLGAYESKSVGDISGSNDIRSLQQTYIKFVKNQVRNNTPDVIHAHDWLTMEAGIAAKELTKAPLVVHVHATEFDRSASDSGNSLVHEIEYQGLVMADRIIAVSNHTKNVIIERYNIPADKIEVAHNAVDMDTLSDSYQYDQRTYTYLESLKHEGYTIVSTVTRFTSQKGLANLVRAAAKAIFKYDKIVLLLAGDGEQRDELIELSAELGISDKVFFTGFVRGKQWRDAYSVSDVFVMSSVSEPFGLTALEAAHHDNALIISKQSGVGEVLNSVLRYDFWDEDRLADQLVGLAISEALVYELRSGVAGEYSRISWKDVAGICMRVYEKTQTKGYIKASV